MRESHGNDFLPLHVHQVAVIGCVFRDDNGFRVKTLGAAADPEATLLSGFFMTIEPYTPRLVSWNGSGVDLPVLHDRSLIPGVQAQRYWDAGDAHSAFTYKHSIRRYKTENRSVG